jgi:hypothetical protein
MQTTHDLCVGLDHPGSPTRGSQGPMSGLFKKELRLLGPGLVMALATAFCAALLPEKLVSTSTKVWGLLPLSMLFLTLGTFGREFVSGTFSLLVIQPASRSQIWRAKSLSLALSVLLVWGAWVAAIPLQQSINWSVGASGGIPVRPWMCTGLLALLMYSGGLWASLLFRQISAAFWVALLTPFGIFAVIEVFLWQCAKAVAVEVSLAATLAYALAGILFARRMFINAEDASWSGGSLSMPEVSLRLFKSGERRAFRPKAALGAKEIHLHRVQLVLAAGLVVLHLAAIAARTHLVFETNSATKDALNHFWVLWYLMPLFLGAAAVSEERKLGTLGGQLCLPVPSKSQFARKALAAGLLSLLLGFCLPLALDPEFRADLGQQSHQTTEYFRWWLRDAQNSVTGLWTHFILCLFKSFLPWSAQALYAGAALGIGAISYYVSTLSRNVLQAVASALVALALALTLWNLADDPGVIARHTPWCGALIYWIGLPILAAAIAMLTYRNSQKPGIGGKEWRRNLLVLAGALCLAALLTTAVYNRAWEIFSPLERPGGMARLTPGSGHLAWFESSPWMQSSTLMVNLPDGRRELKWIRFSKSNPFNPGLEEDLQLGGAQILEGTDWQQVGRFWGSLVGIRRDGTLWVSQRPMRYQRPCSKRFTTMVPHPAGGKWKAFGYSMLIKSDGTLWGWKTDNNEDQSPELSHIALKQVGEDSDWGGFCFRGLQKANGEAWRICSQYDSVPKVQLEKDLFIQRFPALDGMKLTSVVGCPVSGRVLGHLIFAIPPDGTFREIENNHVEDEKYRRWVTESRNLQLGPENRWVQACGDSGEIITLKSDGTLWKWNFRSWPEIDPKGYSCEQVGTRSDWVGVVDYHVWGGGSNFGIGGTGFIALAADGGLWFWEKNREGFELLPPSRKPQYIGNIFGGNPAL